MSTPRQSLATRRDKRQPKIPARFDDFSEIPPSTYLRNYLGESPKNVNNTSNSPFHPSIFNTCAPLPGAATGENFSTLKDITGPSTFPQQPPVAENPRSLTPTPSPPAKEVQSKPADFATTTTVAAAATATAAAPAVAEPPPKKTKTKEATVIAPKSEAVITTNLQQQGAKVQYPKYATHSMQYGAATRFLINEPIYLPRSVATIAPITTTYEQIVNASRKPPFLSKKAEAYISYQNGRKFNYIISLHSTLTRIAEQLPVEDLVCLRAVNKTWRAIVDSDAIWQRQVVFNSGVNVNWRTFYSNIVEKFGTKRLILNDYVYKLPDVTIDDSTKQLMADAETLSQLLLPDDGNLHNQPITRIDIKSTEPEQNSFALALILFLYSQQNLHYCKKNKSSLRISWQVKCFVDTDGFAKFPIANNFSKQITEKIKPVWFADLLNEHIYSTNLENTQQTGDKQDQPRLIDYFELREALGKTLYNQQTANTLKTVVIAI